MNTPLKNRMLRSVRVSKRFPVNLGAVNGSALALIAQTGHPQTLAVEQTGPCSPAALRQILVTPAVAQQTLAAKDYERCADRFYRQGYFQAAIQAYCCAIALAPYEDDILYLSVGVVYFELGELELARQYFAAAVEVNPRNECIARQFEPLHSGRGDQRTFAPEWTHTATRPVSATRSD